MNLVILISILCASSCSWNLGNYLGDGVCSDISCRGGPMCSHYKTTSFKSSLRLGSRFPNCGLSNLIETGFCSFIKIQPDIMLFETVNIARGAQC